MREYLTYRGQEAMLTGWWVLLISLLLPVFGGLTTDAGQLIPGWLLVCAASIALFGFALMLLGLALVALASGVSWAVGQFSRRRHDRAWRRC